METRKQVLIVGAGISGLSAAWWLQQAGVDVAVIEARPRFGGRILTRMIDGHEQGQSVALDLGPSWFWPGQPLIAGLLEHFKIGFFEQHGRGDSLFETHGGQVHRNPPPSPMSGALRVQGGLGRLTRALADDLAPGTVRLNHRATRIAAQDEGVCIEAEGPKGAEVFVANQAALAIPPRLFAGVDTSRSSQVCSSANMDGWACEILRGLRSPVLARQWFERQCAQHARSAGRDPRCVVVCIKYHRGDNRPSKRIAFWRADGFRGPGCAVWLCSV